MHSIASTSVFKSIAVSLFALSASARIIQRDFFTEPPCAVPFTPFLYAGCYTDPSSPRALPFSPAGWNTQNATIEACVAECKGNGYRYAGLEYYGECFCGDSIAGAATTDDQCTFACSGNKSETCGGNDILSVYMDPTFPATNAADISDYSPEGCYAEGNNGRAVVYRQDQLGSANLTTETCLSACKSQNYPLAATEYGGECYCGVVLGNGTTSAPSSACNMPCNGNSSEICGGPALLNLYVANDLMSSEPCSPFRLPPPVVSSSSTTSTTSTTSTSSTSSTASGAPTTTSTSSTSSTSTTTSSTPAPPTTTSTSSTTTSSTSTSSSAARSTSSSSSASSTSSSSSTSTTSSTLTTSTTSTSSTPSTSSTSTTSTTSSKSTMSTSTTSTSLTSSTSSTTTTTSTKCTSTAPAPTCEYSCGNWCSKPLPTFSASTECKIAVAECVLQIADCFLTAGWPASLQCAKYQSWCSSISTYCATTCIGSSCSKSDCVKKNPPVPPPSATTTVGVCTSTSTTATTSTAAPVPTVTSICALPNGPKGSGYESGTCVGGIQPPALTCNNLLSTFPQYPFKLYTDQDSTKCSGYSKPNVPQGCKDACQAQYNSCIGTYATGCKGQVQSGSQDSYQSATTKCQNQYQDCLNVNSAVSGGSRCSSFGVGWS